MWVCWRVGLWVCVTIAVPFLNIDDGKFLSNIMQQSECTIKISLVSYSYYLL